MNNITKMKILKPVNEVFEAFVDPSKIGNFWFSSSSQRWEQGKTITLKYDEYDAQGDMKITEIELNKKIVFHWGTNGVITAIKTYRICHLIYHRVTYALPFCANLLTISHR